MNLRSAVPTLVALALALLVGIALLLLVGAPPLEALWLLVEGSFGSASKISATLLAWSPLLLASAGLVITFAAGLWNIGVEGQIIMGGIAATWIARSLPGPGWVVIPAAILAGAIGGMLWAVFAGVLKTHGHVHEIFGGLGLDFVAAGFATYLVIGPWKRAGVASTSGTDIFRPEAWMPEFHAFGVDWPVIPVILGLLAVVLVWFLLRGTLFGLRLKAVGSNYQNTTSPCSLRNVAFRPNPCHIIGRHIFQFVYFGLALVARHPQSPQNLVFQEIVFSSTLNFYSAVYG